MLGASFFAIIAFVALFVALKPSAPVGAVIGATVAVIVHVLFLAYYPVMLALGQLAKHYQNAAAAQQRSFATAAEALVAINNAFNPLYEAAFAVGILFLSLAMLHSPFGKKVAVLGMVTTVAAFVGLSLWSVLGIGYFWWWLLFVFWFVVAGWKLYQLGVKVSRDRCESTV